MTIILGSGVNNYYSTNIFYKSKITVLKVLQKSLVDRSIKECSLKYQIVGLKDFKKLS